MSNGRLAIDFETYLISENEGFAPRPVCLSFANDIEQGVITAAEVEGFLMSRPEGEEWIAHNLAFEFGVIWKHYPALRELMMRKLDKNELYCTMIANQYADIQKVKPSGKHSLADLVLKNFAIDLSEDKKSPDSWRLRYSELDGIPIDMYPTEAYDYALMDSVYALKIRALQTKNHPMTVKAMCMLTLASEYGFEIRTDYLENLMHETEEAMEPLRNFLVMEDIAGYDKKGNFKKKSKLFRERLKEEDIAELQYTDKKDKEGNDTISIARKALKSYDVDPASVWLDYSTLEKKLTAFLRPLSKATKVVRTSYNALVNTGRTSARGSSLLPSLNFQQLPREGGIRETMKGPEGHVVVSIDFSALELVSTAHRLFEMYGSSKMLEAINYGDVPVDMHAMTAARIMGSDKGYDMSYEHFVAHKKEKEYDHYRRLAKVVNLSLPGGVGPKKLVMMAKDSYGVDISYREAIRLRDLFMAMYPELSRFLKTDIDRLKTGQKLHIPDPKDKKKILVLDEYFYRIGDFVRRGCLYTSAANGILLQTASAFGAKRSIYEVGKVAIESKDDIKLAAFIHDECVLFVKDNEKLQSNIAKAAYAMIDGMQTVFPLARITVESDYGPFFSKSHGREQTFFRNPVKKS